MYAKCVKGHVLRDAEDWILCENLPAPDATCWQEGGDTIFSLKAKAKQRSSTTGQPGTEPQGAASGAATQRAGS